MGTPEDVAGECNARLYIGDDYGDNHATMRCGLFPSHEPPHKEVFERRGGMVTVTWDHDERSEDEDDAQSLDL